MADRSAHLLAALASPVRLRIVRLLQCGPMTSGGIARAAGMTPSTATIHLRVMLAAGVLTRRKVGRQADYSLNPDTFSPGPPPALAVDGVRVELPG
jgi:DNA-binding transcriptional ArsR family regulator